jgi:hypothetical protein
MVTAAQVSKAPSFLGPAMPSERLALSSFIVVVVISPPSRRRTVIARGIRRRLGAAASDDRPLGFRTTH